MALVLGSLAASIAGIMLLLRSLSRHALRGRGYAPPEADARADAEAAQLLGWGAPEPLSDEWLRAELARVDHVLAAARADMDRAVAQLLGADLAWVVDRDDQVLAELERAIAVDAATMRALGDTQEIPVVRPRRELVAA
ncbi:MAG TPA: hypothetical protein VFM54_13315 [Micromonosporaceae bacterium]|nr:hypothetical protein [Micromonosporaceae bacterium]